MPKTVLVVEDESNIRELLRMYLEQEGYIVEVASNGAEGLKMTKIVHPNLILLDIMMPVMDGVQMMRELWTFSTVPVIMLTAKSDTLDKVAGLELGADDYITKPFEMREVMARVKAVLRRFEGDGSSHRLEFDNLIIDKDAFNITVKG
ncbi:MAG: response regulator transcription factor, partial [Clostridia bacterium]|nr:response regulator transcription factor [Clostridia bacterium]